jgi:hypothetical protein
VAVVILRDGEYNFPTCTNGIDQVWYFLFVPGKVLVMCIK